MGASPGVRGLKREGATTMSTTFTQSRGLGWNKPGSRGAIARQNITDNIGTKIMEQLTPVRLTLLDLGLSQFTGRDGDAHMALQAGLKMANIRSARCHHARTRPGVFPASATLLSTCSTTTAAPSTCRA
jgi:hypothetical protein